MDEIDWFSFTSITGLRCHRSSDLVALSCGDFKIRVVDIETKKVIRELRGCVKEINDFVGGMIRDDAPHVTLRTNGVSAFRTTGDGSSRLQQTQSFAFGISRLGT